MLLTPTGDQPHNDLAMGQYPVLSRAPPPPLLQTLVAPALFQTLVARHCWGTSNITDRNVAE